MVIGLGARDSKPNAEIVPGHGTGDDAVAAKDSPTGR
jgi:hypothetical protein